MAESLTVKKDTLAAGVQVNAGTTYEITFASSAGGKDPVGELNIVVRDHEGHDAVGAADYKLSGPGGFSQAGKTGADGSIHLSKEIPIDTYTLHVMGSDFPVVPRPKGGSPLFVRVPGAGQEPPPSMHSFGPPPRKDDAPGGKAFLAGLQDHHGAFTPEDREVAFLEQFKNGNVPDFCRKFCSIQLHDAKNKHTATLEVMSDYLAIGSNEDFVRVPLSGLTMQKVADLWGCRIPTQPVADACYHQADKKVAGHNVDFQGPPGPGGSPKYGGMWQASNWAVQLMDDITQGRLVCDSKTPRPPLTQGRCDMNFGLNHHGQCTVPVPHPLTLHAGHRKEVIIHPDDLSVHLAFYGFFTAQGKALQGAGECRHGPAFADCSHGNRMVAPTILVDGKTMDYQAVLADKELCGVITPGGAPFPKHSLRYPDVEIGKNLYHKYIGR